jgi:glyoxylase-like metal-dependent hydrolase (beta-lactamase superfamily II)
MEIAPGIHRIIAPLGERFNAIYLFIGSQAALIVDTGLHPDPRATIVPYLDAIELDRSRVRYIVNTHGDFDHMGGNAAIHELLPDALLMCGEEDRLLVEDVERMIAERYGEFAVEHGLDDSDETKAWIRDNAKAVPIDIGLSGGERVHLGDGWNLEILHTPGHSLGSISVWDPRSRSLAIGDAVLWNAVLLATGEPAFPPTYRYVAPYLATIERLQGMAIERLLTGHYPLYEGSAVAEFLDGSRAYVDRVDEALLAELRDAAPVTLAELTVSLGPVLGDWPAAANQYLCYPLLGHLERLERQGVATRTASSGKEVAWRLMD